MIGFRLSEFVDCIELLDDRPVVDETGLTGKTYESAIPGEAQLAQLRGRDPLAVRLSAAIEDKMGLKLVPRNDRMEVFVIDHVEEPAPD